MFAIILGTIILLIVIMAISMSIPRPYLPPGVKEGDVIRCDTGSIYKVENRLARLFPNSTIYAKHGSPAWKNVACEDIAKMTKGQPYAMSAQ